MPSFVIFDTNKVTGVVDWVWAWVGDPVYDFSRVVRGFELNEPDAETLIDSFATGYESVRAFPDDFDHRRKVYDVIVRLKPLNAFDEWGPKSGDRQEAVATQVEENMMELIERAHSSA
ncbi:phosphotransferase [Halocatena halophila]|uniref:phosphotransferase n=1 Tax=Halocatena halophila TaxID=2814576 RepID=UPI0038B3588A